MTRTVTYLIAGITFLILMFSADSARAQFRQASPRTLDSLREISDLQYGKEPLQSSRRNQDPEASLPPESGRSQSWASQASWLMYALLGGLLILIGVVVLRQFSGSGKAVAAASLAEEPTNLKELEMTDFGSLIGAAEQEENWREALRFRHLRLLSQLQNRQLIDWHPYKTDADYARELADTPFFKGFQQLRRAFAITWYGEFSLSQQQYQDLLRLFRPFDQLSVSSR